VFEVESVLLYFFDEQQGSKVSTKITLFKGQRLHLYLKIRQSYASDFLTLFKIWFAASK